MPWLEPANHPVQHREDRAAYRPGIRISIAAGFDACEHDPSKKLFVGVAQFLRFFEQPTILHAAVAHQHRDEAMVMRFEVVGVCRHKAAKSLRGLVVTINSDIYSFKKALERPDDDSLVYFLLVREVMVDRGLGDADRFRDTS